MEIVFKGRQTDVTAKFREYAAAKLGKLGKLDHKVMRVDVEVSVERNPRLASQKERVELTIRSRGPAIRAEAAAEDRMAAFDLALAKLDSRLRRALDRRKSRHGGHVAERTASRRAGVPGEVVQGPGLPEAAQVPAQVGASQMREEPAGPTETSGGDVSGGAPGAIPGAVGSEADSVVPVDMEGDGPLVVRQKFHQAKPISIEQALFEMELVGHDFYLFHDIASDMPSVVYRRRGYQYGVIRLVETSADGEPAAARSARGRGNGDRADAAASSARRFAGAASRPGDRAG